MRKFSSLTDPKLAACLLKGGVVVIPTDTLYGICARASNQQAVERVYALRGRAPEKPCIILVSDLWQITDNTAWTPLHKKLAETYWPGALSLVAPTVTEPEYLHRGTETLAYRMPEHIGLRRLLSETGPLIAPSANLEGQPAATTIEEAFAYFGNKVDGYVDVGPVANVVPSTVVRIDDGRVNVLRPGAVTISEQVTHWSPS